MVPGWLWSTRRAHGRAGGGGVTPTGGGAGRSGGAPADVGTSGTAAGTGSVHPSVS